jgi:glutamine amidotransferase-like uncharacterized protein
MKVAREATQLPAEQLVSYEEFVKRLAKLATSPRVVIEQLGLSHARRGLYAIIVGDAEGLAHRDYYRTLARNLERPALVHQTPTNWQKSERPVPPPDMRYPVLIIGETFGHEAAHVEALLALADRLAWEDGAGIDDLLAHLIIVIVPMINPDGREIAIDLWKRSPLGQDGAAAGNHYGFYTNRDFLHLTQPENRAVLRLFREWHPLVILDTHEDAFLLGAITPEVCWCPAFGTATVGKAPAKMHTIVDGLSQAIARAWDEQGYLHLHADMFAFPMLGQPTDKPHWFWLGDLVRSMVRHGTPSVIVESARAPGTQPWEDRLGQKITAGLALMQEVVVKANSIADTTYQNGENALVAGAGDAFLIPVDQDDTGAVASVIRVLLQHEVLVYRTESPQRCFVVPLSQPEAAIATTLLSGDESKMAALPPATGIDVSRLSLLPERDRSAFANAEVKPIVEAPLPSLKIDGKKTAVLNLAIPNTWDGVRLVNRLRRLGLPVGWLAEPLVLNGKSVSVGTFIVQAVPSGSLDVLAANLYVRLTVLPPKTHVKVRPLRKPVVGLYVGEGVDSSDSSAKAEMWWALQQLEFDLLPLHALDVKAARFDSCSVLVVPDGDAGDIVQGWQKRNEQSRTVWDPPPAAEGIGTAGLEAIRHFVREGGSYIGIGSGGGLLALADYADLINVTVAHHSLGSARVILSTEDHPLTYGLFGYQDERGTWHDHLIPAMYYTESLYHVAGGPIFAAGEGAQAIACYQDVEYDPDDHHVVQPELFRQKPQGLAVATQAVGKGQATVIGIRPGFRAFWTQTCKLISNAVFYAVSDKVYNITLDQGE